MRIKKFNAGTGSRMKSEFPYVHAREAAPKASIHMSSADSVVQSHKKDVNTILKSIVLPTLIPGVKLFLLYVKHVCLWSFSGYQQLLYEVLVETEMPFLYAFCGNLLSNKILVQALKNIFRRGGPAARRHDKIRCCEMQIAEMRPGGGANCPRGSAERAFAFYKESVRNKPAKAFTLAFV
ncbi:hypothetical protein EVAR_93640_1 [Eumeta japonica]|uniref:Uncharacterized protein n=1 Tax=Eumeta variegata TaxID=151549 RepID=A0A4C1TQL4_EUMVA|nr:hypothetical protein EVAR_93640_1 [Eumeta japonica]